MIKPDRLNHMLAVAYKCYSLAKEKGVSEETAQAYFVMGFLHDIGYAFAHNPSEHNKVGKSVIENFIANPQMLEAIGNHGVLKGSYTDAERILNIADLTTTHDGSSCTVDERLEGIKERYSRDSSHYIGAIKLAESLGLVDKCSLAMKYCPLGMEDGFMVNDNVKHLINEGNSLPRRILLYGGSGTGKSVTANLIKKVISEKVYIVDTKEEGVTRTAFLASCADIGDNRVVILCYPSEVGTFKGMYDLKVDVTPSKSDLHNYVQKVAFWEDVLLPDYELNPMLEGIESYTDALEKLEVYLREEC